MFPHSTLRSKNASTTYVYALTVLIWGGMCMGQEQRVLAFAQLLECVYTSKKVEYYW